MGSATSQASQTTNGAAVDGPQPAPNATANGTNGPNGHPSRSHWWMRYIILRAVQANDEDCFKRLCSRFVNDEDEGEMLRYAFRIAIKNESQHLILNTIRGCQSRWPNRRRMLHLSVALGVSSGQWNFVRQVVHTHRRTYFWMDYFVHDQQYVKVTEYWPFLIPIVESLITNHYLDFDYFIKAGVMTQLRSSELERLLLWCEQNSCWSLALYLALASADWVTVRRIILEKPRSLHTHMLELVIEMSSDEQAWGVLTACLRRTPEAEFESVKMICLSVLNNSDALELIERCQSEGMTCWAARLAGLINRWDIANVLLDECSATEDPLHTILEEAITQGEVATAKKLLNMTDPRLCFLKYFDSGPLFLLSEALYCGNDEMVILCIQAGVSPHQQVGHFEPSPMRSGLIRPRYLGGPSLPMVKALFEAGASSHAELQRLMTDTIREWGLAKGKIKEIFQYVEATINTPRTLQSLCRLSISHLIGCQQGRENRVRSLEISWSMQDYILFNDLVTYAV